MVKLNLSPSRVERYLSCGERLRRSDEERERAPPTIYAVAGKAIHQAAELSNREKLAGREHFDVEDSQRLAIHTMDCLIREEGLADTFASHAERIEVLDSTIGFVERVMDLYTSTVAREYVPEMVEQPFAFEFSDLVNLRGFIDLAARHVKTGKTAIVDVKSRRRKRKVAESHGSRQLSIYTLGYASITGSLPDYAVLETLVDTKNKTERQPLVTTRTAEDYEALRNTIEIVAAGIKAGNYLPATYGTDWQCSIKWCEFFRTCKYVSNRVVQIELRNWKGQDDGEA